MQSLRSVHTVAVTDLSRFARSMLLLTDIVDNFVRHKVHVQGVVLDDLGWLSGGDEHSRIMVLLLGHLAEQRLTEVLMNTIRGLVTMLQSGKPHGTLPSWVSRSSNGIASLNEKARTVQRLIDLYLETGTTHRTALRLQEESATHPPFGQHGKGGIIWQENTVRRILVNPALIGKQEFFGLEWDTLRECRLVGDDTWERLQSRVRSQAKRYTPPPRENAYLASQLLRCHCGHKMTHRPHSAGVLQYICGAKTTERSIDTSYRHIIIQADSVDIFLDELMRYDAALVLGEWQDSIERNWIRDELERMRAEVGEIDAHLPEAEAVAREEARQRLSAAGLAHEEVIAAAARTMIAELLGAREQLQIAIADRQRRLAGLLQSDELRSLEERVRRWESLPVPDRNALLLTLFRELRFEGTAPHERLVPVLRTLEGKELPAIHLKTTGTRIFKRRLPSVGEWITSWAERETG